MNNPLSDKDFMNFPKYHLFICLFSFQGLIAVGNRNFLYAATSLQIFHFMDFLMKKCLPYKRLSEAFLYNGKVPKSTWKK